MRNKLKNKDREKWFWRNQKKEIQKFIKNADRIPSQVGSPEKLGEYHKQWLRRLGFHIYSSAGIFFLCSYPDGWSFEVEPITLNWIYLLDKNGKRRAVIYYKFQGRKKKAVQVSAFINYMQRYRVMVDHVEGLKPDRSNKEEHFNSPLQAFIIDGGVDVIEKSEPIKFENKYGTKLYEQEKKEIKSRLFHDMEKQLKERFPLAYQIDKYWSDENEKNN